MRKLFRDGQGKLTAKQLNAIGEETLRSITPGPGIRIHPTGTGICIGLEKERRLPSFYEFPNYMWKAQIESFDLDTERINCYLWDYTKKIWDIEKGTIKVYKPFMFRITSWLGTLITYQDGRQISYSITDIDPMYQRKAHWTEEEEEYSEVQEITSPYYIGEELDIFRMRDGYFYDNNTAGKHWAALPEEEE